MYKSTQLHKLTSKLVPKYASIRLKKVYKYTNTQVYKYTSTQVYKYTGIQVQKYIGNQNIGSQIHY